MTEGELAPDFELPDQDGNPVRLSSLRGRTVVVYFYPKADTPGCTAQACAIRDRESEFDDAGAVVLGISPDPVPRLRRFADKYGLPFALLSDEDHAVAEAYGVWVHKPARGYMKARMGIEQLPEPMEKNLYHLSADERKRLGIEQLPETLGEAIELTAESELVLRVLGEHTFDRFIEIKRQEWEDYRVQVTQWELDRYMAIL